MTHELNLPNQEPSTEELCIEAFEKGERTSISDRIDTLRNAISSQIAPEAPVSPPNTDVPKVEKSPETPPERSESV